MAGTIVADTLTHSTAGSLDTSYVVNGSAKAWVNFDGTGTIATRDSLSVSGLVDNGTGNYTVNITNALSNDDYASVASGNNALSLQYPFQARNSSSSACQIGSYNLSSFADMANVHLILHGDLA
jgi:hypothetical protein